MFTFYQIMMRWDKLHPEGITVKLFLQMLKKWESAGFIASDVWSNLDDMINSDNIESAVCNILQESKENDKLSPEHNPDARLLGCVARYVLESRALHFALDMLALPLGIYSEVEYDLKDDKDLMNLMVRQVFLCSPD